MVELYDDDSSSEDEDWDGFVDDLKENTEPLTGSYEKIKKKEMSIRTKLL